MNRALRWTGMVCIGACLWAPRAFAQPALTGPATNNPEPAGEAGGKPESPSTVYVIKKNDVEPNAPPADDALSASKAAVEGRHQALEQFRQGNEALRRGYTDAAAAIFEPLKLNPHLTSQERRQIVRICEQMHQKEARRGEAMTHTNRAATPRPDPNAMLADGRRAFEMRNYDQAELLARQSQLAGHSSFLPWSDTPTKLLKDVQVARQREIVIPKVDSRRAMQPPQVSGSPSVAQAPPRPAGADPLTPPANTPPVARSEGDTREARAASARRLLEQAFMAARGGDVARARQLLQDVETLKLTFSPAEPHTPEKVRLEISRVELAARAKPAEGPAGIQQAAAKSTMPAKPTPSAGAPHSTRPAEPPAMPPSQDARVLVTEARRHYQAGRYDQAVALAKQAQLTPGGKWGHFEDSPDRIFSDVAKVRHDHNEKHAAELLTEARKLLTQNRCDEAEKLTYQAETLRSEYPIWYAGERHDKLRQEIVERRRSLVKPTLPPLLDPVPLPAVAAKPPEVKMPKSLLEPRKPASDIIASTPGVPRGDGTPRHVAAAAPRPEPNAAPLPQQAGGRRKASSFLAECRQQQKEGLLLSARALHDQAKDCHAAGGLENDVTAEQLTQASSELRKAAFNQMQEFGTAVQTLTAHGSYKEAERYLQYMQQLTATFELGDQATPTGRPVYGVVQASGPVPGRMPRLPEEHMHEIGKGSGSGPINVTVIVNANGDTPVLVNDPGRRVTVVQPQK